MVLLELKSGGAYFKDVRRVVVAPSVEDRAVPEDWAEKVAAIQLLRARWMFVLQFGSHVAPLVHEFGSTDAVIAFASYHFLGSSAASFSLYRRYDDGYWCEVWHHRNESDKDWF